MTKHGRAADMRGFEINGLMSPLPGDYGNIESIVWDPRISTEERSPVVMVERDEPREWQMNPPEACFRVTIAERQFIFTATGKPVSGDESRFRPELVCRRVGQAGIMHRSYPVGSNDMYDRLRDAAESGEGLQLTQKETVLLAEKIDSLISKVHDLHVITESMINRR